MIRKSALITVVVSIFLLVGCSAVQNLVDGGSQPCVQKVAIAKATVGQVVYQANAAYDGEIIDLKTFQEIDDITDQANAATTSALTMCTVDEDAAKNLLRSVNTFIIKSQLLLKKESN